MAVYSLTRSICVVMLCPQQLGHYTLTLNMCILLSSHVTGDGQSPHLPSCPVLFPCQLL